MEKERTFGLNGNQLKILAAVTMLIDHIGVLFYPDVMILRYIGRLSMPIFAFMIAEGCRYTKNKWKYFSLVFGLGAGCQLVYYLFAKDTYLNILLTFSFSIVMIYAMQYAKRNLLDKGAKCWKKVCSCGMFILTVALTWLFCEIALRTEAYTVDYGFWGCTLPVFASLLDVQRIPAPVVLQKADKIPWRVACLGVGLLCLQMYYQSINPWLASISIYSFLSLIFLFLYNGKRGKRKMKYFFYIFYPLHLVLLEGVWIVLYILNKLP